MSSSETVEVVVFANTRKEAENFRISEAEWSDELHYADYEVSDVDTASLGSEWANSLPYGGMG